MTTPSINPIYADVSTLKGRYAALAAGCLEVKPVPVNEKLLNLARKAAHLPSSNA